MEEVVETGYLQDGKTQVDPNDVRAVAKNTEFKDGKYRYYVKIGPEGNIFNPYGQHARGTAHLSAKRTGGFIWRFVEVNEACYTQYIAFLQTRNQRSLSYAERELRNG